MSIGDRVKALREARGWSQTRLAQEVTRRGGKLSQQNVANIETGIVRQPKALLHLSMTLGVTPQWLETGRGPQAPQLAPARPISRPHDDDRPETPIAHYVGAGDEVHLLDGDDSPVDYTPAPPGFEREKGAAVQVRGESMRPLFEPGDLLFFRQRRVAPRTPKEIPDRPVIVQVKDGPLYVKRLLPGTGRGRFHLLSINPLTPILHDQLVESYAVIEWTKHRVM